LCVFINPDIAEKESILWIGKIESLFLIDENHTIINQYHHV